MAEKLHTHPFNPDKTNRFRCADCPYLSNNPIHIRQPSTGGSYIRGVAHPNKTG